MTPSPRTAGLARNVTLYPWFRFFQNLLFWQAIWFLYFQNRLSAADAIVLYAVYDIATTVLEVPSGYMSDRLGRRITLITAALAGALGMALLAVGDSFAMFALGQVLMGASAAFASGTDSALLYESLAATSREDEIEAQELRAWRFAFVGLALSAVTGGAMALWAAALPFYVAALSLTVSLILALRFIEPEEVTSPIPQGAELVRLGSLRSALTEPVLIWLFVLTVLMYGFSHLPFVFGQPFIAEALSTAGFSAETPLVSGAVTTLMMILSLAASLIAPRLRQRMGLGAVLLAAFGMQIALVAMLALTNSAIAIAFLFFRMVPNSLSRPFILARLQPMLKNDSRATYLSLQSLCGRLAFAGSLLLASRVTSTEEQMAYADIRQILTWYVVVGLIALSALALAMRRIQLDPAGRNTAPLSE